MGHNVPPVSSGDSVRGIHTPCGIDAYSMAGSCSRENPRDILWEHGRGVHHYCYPMRHIRLPKAPVGIESSTRSISYFVATIEHALLPSHYTGLNITPDSKRRLSPVKFLNHREDMSFNFVRSAVFMPQTPIIGNRKAFSRKISCLSISALCTAVKIAL